MMAAAIAMISAAGALQSCMDTQEPDVYRQTAVVTVRPNADGSFVMQLNNNTVLQPTNMSRSPYGQKEVRALVDYTLTAASDSRATAIFNVNVNGIDSIRTKLPVYTVGSLDDKTYGNDPIEIVKDWVTVAEDGYLTLRVRTAWSNAKTDHYINLVTGINPDDPYEVELRHDARGDVNGAMADALVAFNLNKLPRPEGGVAKLKVKWTSFSGPKSTEFELQMHNDE